MQWNAGLIALLLLGTAAAQVPDLPDVPEAPDIPDDVPETPDPPAAEPPAMEDPGLPAFNLPNGSSQPAAELQEYQHAIWSDGRHVSDVPRDGYDLIDLRVWEADHRDLGAGLVLRMEFAGNAIAGVQYIIAGDLLIEESNATPTVRLWTEDGDAWDSDQVILEQIWFQEDPVAPNVSIAPRHHVVHLLVSYDDLNATIGQTVQGWAFEALTDTGEMVVRTDIAPGGYYIVPTVELPELNSAGEIDNESFANTASQPPGIFLGGAGQHIDFEGAWEQGIATMTITNPYEETAQYIAMAYPEAATPLTQTDGWIEPGASLQWQFRVPQENDAQRLQWDIRTDIGGVALVEVTVPAIPPEPREPEPVPFERTDEMAEPADHMDGDQGSDEGKDDGGGKDSPGLGLLILVALGVAVWVRRR